MIQIPFFTWIKAYKQAYFRGDLSAGATVAVMLIPQGMAYAMLAGLPPIYGLYASLVPLAVYAIFGTSKQLAVGPVAMVSLLVATGVSQLAEAGTENYLAFALALALLVGLIQFLLGIFRMGFVVNFLSHPVISGFISAAAIIIGLSQLKHLLGISLGRSSFVHEILYEVYVHASEINLITLAIGLGGIVIIWLLRAWNKQFPGALVVVILGILVVQIFGLDAHGIKVLGEVPSGLPSFAIPQFSIDILSTLLPIAAIIALVGFMESIAVAKSMASKNRYEVNANQELVALGLANVLGSFFQAYPTTGGISRTAVNDQAGAVTPMASLITAFIMAISLLFLMPYFYYLPQAILAAIIMVAVFGLIDLKEARYLWKMDKGEFAVFIITFIATLAIGIEEGIGIGVVASLLMLVRTSSQPHIAEIGKLPDSTHFRNVERFPEAQTFENILILRMDASLHFANATTFKETLFDYIEEKSSIDYVLLDAFAINNIDTSALHLLSDSIEALQEKKITFLVSGIKGPVMDILKKAALLDKIGVEHFFLRPYEAVTFVLNKQETSTSETVHSLEQN